MGFPAIHYGNIGDEKVSSSTKINGFPLGIKMALPDGRMYVHARLGGTAAVAGNLYQSGSTLAQGADTTYAGGLALAATVAVGATTVLVTTGGTTAVTKDRFADGYLSVGSSTGTGIGYLYKIKANNSSATGGTTTVTLYETDPVIVAMAGATTTVGLAENEYSRCEANIANSTDQRIAGVAANSAAASAYVWLQTNGMAAVRLGASILRDQGPVVCSTATAGGVGPIVAGSAAPINQMKTSWTQVGTGYLNNAVTGGFAVVDLNVR